MTQLRWLQTNYLSSRLLIAGVLGFSLIFTSSALARYVPPSKPSNPSRTGSTGTRGGCGEATETSLTVLAPVGHSGQTVAAHPTFAWFVPDKRSYTMEFTLYEPSARGGYSILYTMQQSTKEGIMSLSLPKNVPGLSDRQTYLWQVALLCDPSDPSKDQLARATVDVVSMPPGLKAALAQAPDHLKRADLYAQAGFWYDAFAETLEGSSNKPFWLALLENLSHLETPSPVVEAHKQGEQLQSIVATERRTR